MRLRDSVRSYCFCKELNAYPTPCPQHLGWYRRPERLTWGEWLMLGVAIVVVTITRAIVLTALAVVLYNLVGFVARGSMTRMRNPAEAPVDAPEWVRQ